MSGKPRKFSDPGGEVVNAPVGSAEWAKRIRLELNSIIKDLPKVPERAKRYLDVIRQHRAWTLLNKEDGGPFSTFEEFCAHPQPWGLGKPYAEIEPFLEAAVGKRHLQLVTVAPAQSPPGKIPDTVSDISAGDARRAGRLRAIAERAPEPVRQLYRDGLLGQDVAAKLGPKSPSPDDAKRMHEVAYALETQAKALGKPKDETQRLATQKALNRRARQLLGDDTDDQVAKLLRTIAKLSEEDRQRLLEALKEQYG